MLLKKIIIGCSISLSLLGIILLCSNILILDDVHPEISETALETNEILPGNETVSPTQLEEKPTVPNQPQAKKGYHIHINLDAYVMYVYKDGTLIKTYPVSGGKRSTPSPLGTWRIISKDTWGEGFGGAWLGFNVPYGKYGIHGTTYPWFIGKSNSSKGCIRMNNKDVKELYKLVPHGTAVTIAYDSMPFRVLKSGDIGPDVKNLQKNLQKLGFYSGGSDGKFGTSLKNSVIKFQKANKLKANGIVSKQTHDLIIQKVKTTEEQPQ